jgi:Domain of unknown function (DUF4149)
MVSPRLRRAAAWLAGAWTGLIGAIGFVAAPVLFSALPRADAGRVAGRLFAVDATIGVCVGAVLLLVALQLGRDDAERGGSRFSVEMMLVLVALFCIVAGHYAIVPIMEAAGRGGEGGPSFAVLHGVSAAFFALKFLVAGVLAWRLSGVRRVPAVGATPAAPTS